MNGSRLSFKQHMPMKPNKLAYRSGFVAIRIVTISHRFKLTLGKTNQIVNVLLVKAWDTMLSGLSVSLIQLQTIIFFFDNFFTSVDLVKSLQKRKS